jgi:hypothetical protein
MVKNIKTENDLIREVIPIISTMNDRNSKVIAIPEVPRAWRGSDNMDLLLMSLKTREMMAIEFKLSNEKKLLGQIYDNQKKTGIKTIGIMPKNARHPKIFSIDNDAQIERFCAHLLDAYDTNWTKPHPNNNSLIYWYAYKDIENINYSNAGTPWGSKKDGFTEVYKLALRNIMKEIESTGLSALMACHMMRGYAESSVKKFMREIKK